MPLMSLSLSCLSMMLCLPGWRSWLWSKGLDSVLCLPTGRMSPISRARSALGGSTAKGNSQVTLLQTGTGLPKKGETSPGSPCKDQLPPPRATQEGFLGWTRCRPHLSPSHGGGPRAANQ